MTPETRALEDAWLRVTAMALDAVYGAMERVGQRCDECGGCLTNHTGDQHRAAQAEGRTEP